MGTLEQTGQYPAGESVRGEIDDNHDKNGKVVRVEKDRNFDGKPDLIQKP